MRMSHRADCDITMVNFHIVACHRELTVTSQWSGFIDIVACHRELPVTLQCLSFT